MWLSAVWLGAGRPTSVFAPLAVPRGGVGWRGTSTHRGTDASFTSGFLGSRPAFGDERCTGSGGRRRLVLRLQGPSAAHRGTRGGGRRRVGAHALVHRGPPLLLAAVGPR